MFYRVLFLSALLLVFVKPLTANDNVTVLRVIDGDTLIVRLLNGDKETIRLSNIDAPEMDQPYGKESYLSLKQKAEGNIVSIVSHTKDRYGRTIGLILYKGRNLNKEMISEGSAWVYTKYNIDPSLPETEKTARNKKLGLWKDSNAISPWDWRKRKNKNSNSICKIRKSCTDILHCEEAHYLLKFCHFTYLDKNNNGIPCENLCKN